MVFPQLAWSLAVIQSPFAVRLHIAGLVLEIAALGKWNSAPPKGKFKLPDARRRESPQSYFHRVLPLFLTPDKTSVDYSAWLDSRAWVGERADDLLAAIRAGKDLPDHQCRIINPQT
jgi:hypothetical protein